LIWKKIRIASPVKRLNCGTCSQKGW
jgi:hypothetical protein